MNASAIPEEQRILLEYKKSSESRKNELRKIGCREMGNDLPRCKSTPPVSNKAQERNPIRTHSISYCGD
jgi:hypothetical protein